MLRIAVIDDEPKDREILRKALEQYAQEHALAFQITEMSDGEDITENYGARFDLLFLDVEMRFQDGMSAAEQIRELDKEVPIVFVTYNPRYAVQGYRVGAADYLVKPLRPEEFDDCMQRVLRMVRRDENRYVSISERGTTRKLDISRIYYVEVQDHSLCYHTMDGAYETKGAITEVEAVLKDAGFSRCNRCYLVNLDHVSGVRGSDVLVGPETLRISRTRKKEFLDALNDFMA